MFHLTMYLLLAINGAGLILMGLDKWRARRGDRRIPESLLLLPVLLGGAPGAFCGMLLFRHKTRKWGFRWKFALALVVNIAILWGLSGGLR